MPRVRRDDSGWGCPGCHQARKHRERGLRECGWRLPCPGASSKQYHSNIVATVDVLKCHSKKVERLILPAPHGVRSLRSQRHHWRFARGQGDEVSEAESRRRRSIFERALVHTKVRLLLALEEDEVNDWRRPEVAVSRACSRRWI